MDGVVVSRQASVRISQDPDDPGLLSLLGGDVAGEGDVLHGAVVEAVGRPDVLHLHGSLANILTSVLGISIVINMNMMSCVVSLPEWNTRGLRVFLSMETTFI